MLNPFLAPRVCTMLKILTKKLRNQSLNEIQPFQLKVRKAGFASVVFFCPLQVTAERALRSWKLGVFIMLGQFPLRQCAQEELA